MNNLNTKSIFWAGLLAGFASASLSAQSTLQLVHASDLEGGLDALNRAANFGAIIESIEDPETLVVSAGDNYIPGPFFSSAGAFSLQPVLQETYEQLFGEPAGSLGEIEVREGAVDITIMNIIGFDASAIGNHEFDAGSEIFRDLIEEELDDDRVDPPATIAKGEIEWPGAQFPYLSANLDFSGDADLAGVYTPDIFPNTAFTYTPDEAVALKFATSQGDSRKIAPATTVTLNGETYGVIGATTQILEEITSPDGTVVVGPKENDMAALAGIIQPVIDDLEAAGINKIILVTHLQQLSREEELATLLSGIDVIVAGGSDTLLANPGDALNAGDTAARPYPVETTNFDGQKTLIVSTDGEYSYVGRLVVNFDAAGVVTGFDPVSGPIATENPAALAPLGFADYTALKATTTKDDLIQNLVDGVQAIIIQKDSTVYGESGVFLDGRRSQVRTQETNMGNLTADANLAAARAIDPTVAVSFKNGGGIRNAIGEIVQQGDETLFLPTPANPLSGKLQGEISQLDIENTLRFNNKLTLLTLTAQGLADILEHGVADSAPGNTPGRFPQVSGISFSFDYDASPRVRDVAIKDAEGNTLEVIARDGAIVGDPNRPVRIVTLNFLAGGGDGYDFPGLGSNIVDTGIGEQQALADYLVANHGIGQGTPFNDAEVGAGQDGRIQNLMSRSSTVAAPPVVPATEPQLSLLSRYATGIFDEGASEIVNYDIISQRLFSTNADAGSVDIIDLSDPANPALIDTIDVEALFGGNGVSASPNSVDVAYGLVAVAVGLEDDATGEPLRGILAYFDVDGTYLTAVKVGFGPDMVTFTPDGSRVVVANEGEPGPNTDPEGSISIVTTWEAYALVNYPWLARWFKLSPRERTADFRRFNWKKRWLEHQGVRIYGPGATVAQDFEPEYMAVSEDSRFAYVTLQENNALAVVDIWRARVKKVVALGEKDWTSYPGLDVSDRDDTINIEPWPVVGIYQPDAIAYAHVDGRHVVVTANEGDARGFEEERVKDLDLDPAVFTMDGIQEDEALGRLEITTVGSDPDNDGLVEKLISYGARSFSIWEINKRGRFLRGHERISLLWDSGSDFEQITASLLPSEFNSNNDENGSFDSRSDAKGPEPEAITVGHAFGRTFVFVGLERIGGIMVYDISDVDAPRFVQYINTRDFSVDIESPEAGDSGVEGLEFIPAVYSPTGKHLLVASNEVSGTIAVYVFE